MVLVEKPGLLDESLQFLGGNMFAYFIWFASSLACGAIGAWVFAAKRRSPFLGFAIGFALNVVAVLVWKRLSSRSNGGVK